MPKKARELSAIEVKRIIKPGAHPVGGVDGLLLRVSPTGARSWILRKRIGDRRRDVGLGGYPDVPLAQAREAARESGRQIREGIDPVARRSAARDALRAANASRITFDQAARRCVAAKRHEFRNQKHAKQWESTLNTYASPVIGALPVAAVELSHIVTILEPIWTTKTETATRLRGRIETVLAWATVGGYRQGENPARWKGHLDAVLPKPRKLKKVRHHKAVPWQEVGQFVTDLRSRDGIAARALEFAILTAARSGEVRGATWDEIDLARQLWTVPASRIKASKKHCVPLSNEALSLLEALPRIHGCNHVFPATRGGSLSDMSLSAVMRRMGVDAVPHGFRSTFKDWCRSRTSYADEVSELALAHVNSDATRAAYARDELLPQRKRLMRDWARYYDTVQPAGEVVAIRGAK